LSWNRATVAGSVSQPRHTPTTDTAVSSNNPACTRAAVSTPGSVAAPTDDHVSGSALSRVPEVWSWQQPAGTTR